MKTIFLKIGDFKKINPTKKFQNNNVIQGVYNEINYK